MSNSDRPARWKPNWQAWTILVGVLLGLGLLIPWLHARQLRSTQVKIRQRAEQAEAAAAAARAKGDREAYLTALRDAVRGYDACLRHAPEDVGILTRLASVVAEQADASPGNSQLQANAYQVLNRAVSKSPKDAVLWRRLAGFAERQQQWSEAADAWRTVAQLTPGDVEVLVHRAQCLTKLSRYREAIQVLRQAIQWQPRAVPAYILLAKCYRHPTVGDTAAAEGVLADLVQACGDDAVAYAERARFRLWLRVNTRNPQEATEALRHADEDVAQALRLAPDGVAVRIAAAELALEKGNTTDAESHLSDLGVQNIEDPAVLEMRRRVAAAKGDYAALQAVLAKLADREPVRLAEWFQVCLDQDPPDIAGAEKLLDRMRNASFSPDWTEFFALQLQGAQGELREAAAGLEKLLSKCRRGEPLKAEVVLALSQLYLEMRQWERAIALPAELLQESPNARRVRLVYAGILACVGQADRAMAEFQRLEQELGLERLMASQGVASAYLETLVQAATARTTATQARTSAEALLRRYGDRFPEPQRIAAEARLKAVNGDISSALQQLDDALQRFPDNLMLWSAKVDVQALGGDVAGSAATAQEWIRKSPGSSEAVLLLIRAGIQTNDRQASATLLAEARRAAEAFGDASRIFLLRTLAAAYLKLGDTESAAGIWEHLVDADSQDLENRRLLFELARSRRDYAAMEKQVATLCAAAPESAEAAFVEAGFALAQAVRQGTSTDRRRDFLGKAEEMLARGESLRPRWAEFDRLRAELAVLQGRWEAAIRLLQELHARGLATDSQTAQLVQLLFLSGRDDDAEAVLSSMPLDPRRPELRRIQAELLLREGKVDEAIAAAEQGQSGSPDAIEYLWQARLLTRANRFVQAEEKLRAALELAPDWPTPYLTLTSLAVLQGRPDAAKRVLQDASAHLQGPAGLCALALGYETLSDANSAEQYYRRALQLAPQDPGPKLEWAGFLLRTRRWDEGRRALEELIATQNEAPESQWIVRNARRNLAQLLAAGGDYRGFRRAQDLLDQNLRETDAPMDRFLKIRLMAGRPERSLRMQAVDAYEKEARAGVDLPAEDRFQWAVALDSLGRWSDSRAQLDELMRRRTRSAKHLEFYIRKRIEHDSLAGEIRPLLDELQKLASLSWTVDELSARLAARDGDSSEAVRLLEGLLQEDSARSRPRPAATLVLQWFEELGLYQEAENHWRTLAAAQPPAVLGLAAFLGRRGRVDEALELCRTAAASCPPDAVVATAVNVLRNRRQDCTPERIAAVNEIFEIAEKAAGRTAGWLLTRSNFLNFLGRHQEAAPLYRELLQKHDLRESLRAGSQNNLAYVLAASAPARASQDAQPELQEAEALLRQATEVLGPLPNILDTWALLELRRGRPESALNYAQQAVAEAPSPLTYLHLVLALHTLGDRVAAAREWETARRVYDLQAEAVPPIERGAFEKLQAELEKR